MLRMKCYLCYIGLLMVVEQNKFDRFYPNTQGKMASLWIYTSAFLQIHEKNFAWIVYLKSISVSECHKNI